MEWLFKKELIETLPRFNKWERKVKQKVRQNQKKEKNKTKIMEIKKTSDGSDQEEKRAKINLDYPEFDAVDDGGEWRPAIKSSHKP